MIKEFQFNMFLRKHVDRTARIVESIRLPDEKEKTLREENISFLNHLIKINLLDQSAKARALKTIENLRAV